MILAYDLKHKPPNATMYILEAVTLLQQSMYQRLRLGSLHSMSSLCYTANLLSGIYHTRAYIPANNRF